MSSTTPTLRLVLTGTSEEDKNILFETWRSQMSGEDGASNMQIIDQAIAEDRARITAIEENGVLADGYAQSVNDIPPDENGNITISASDVGARPNDWTPSISDVVGLQEAIKDAGKLKTINGQDPDDGGNIDLTWGTLPDKPETFEPSSHEHPWSEITDKPLTYSPSTHTHTASEVGAIAVGSAIDATTLNGLTLEQLKQAIMSEAVYQ